MPAKPLDPDKLRHITAATLGHYNQTAQGFRDGTWDHDVTQNYEALLSEIQGPGPHSILDLGCGPGRDLAYFKARGIEAVGLDGSPEFVRMAHEETGCDVWCQNFLSLELPAQRFDGVFANASLFHVPSQELPGVLSALFATLKPGGVFFSSNPRGDNSEGFNRERYGCYHDLDTWRDFVTSAGFTEIHHYFRPPGLPREQQPWLATVWRK
jgi:SAM-dependent methyltransferase